MYRNHPVGVHSSPFAEQLRLGPHYNPFTLIPYIPARSTDYEQLHELMHLSQHARGTALWRLWWTLKRVPLLGRLAMLGVECEAAWWAIREMSQCRILEGKDVVEALFGLLSYVVALFFGGEDAF